uniref:EGF-like domain-containing protein n=1 Tax=Astatotilapia calliptera TaxID=8154 RepID=A0AAX7TL23_ASTCA
MTQRPAMTSMSVWFLVSAATLFPSLDPSAAVLLLAKRSQIIANRVNIRPPLMSPVITGLSIVTVDFDSVTSKIYWADTKEKKIWSAYQNGTGKQAVFSSGLMVTESIAVDWVGRNLYWTDSVMENIEVSTLDGRYRKVLMSRNITNPRGLVLDPRNHTNLMFWSDWGQNPRIEQASMDGTMRKVIVSTKIYWPNGLALDYTTQRVYFADAYLRYIDYCDYNGNNRYQVMVLQHPYGMTIFEDTIYWSEHYTSKVMSTNKFHGGNITTHMNNVYQPMGIVMAHPIKQPTAINPCSEHLCTQLCLLSTLRPRYYTCHCQSGWKLDADKRTCVKGNFGFTPFSDSLFAEFNSAEYKSVSVMSFLLDSIWRVKTDGTNKTQFAPAAFMGSPAGLAFDWIGRIMYYTNPTAKTIEVSIMLSCLGSLVPANKKLFWSDKGSDSGVPPKVASADMDGSNLVNLYTGSMANIGFITADISTMKLYWGVAGTGVIERGTMDGASRVTVVSSLSHPWGLTIYQNYLYYTDLDYEVIERVEKDTGTNMVVMRSGMSGLHGLKVHARDTGTTNACSSNNGGCPHLCLPKPDNKKTCACTTGFHPSPDGSSCQEYESFAVVSTRSYIRGFHVNSSDHSEAMVDAHIKSGYVYWTENSTYSTYKGIFKARTDGGHYTRVLPSGVGVRGIQGLAVDWIANNLYFTNAHKTETYLEVMAINTTFRMILIKSSEDQPRDVAVSPKLRYLFWTDAGQTPKIERALLDGTNRTVLASESLASPRGLTVDYSNNFLYWTDDVLDMISRMAIDGTERQIIRYGSRYPSPMGLAILGNYILWVDKRLGKLFQASKDPANTDQPEVNIEFPTSANLVGFNPCHEDNGRCQQLCFAIPDKQGPKCACAHGTLLGNGVSCGYEPDEFLVFSTGYTLNSQRLDPTDHSLPYPTVTLGNGVMGLDYDFREKRIFFMQYVGIGRSRIGYITTTSVTSPPVTIISSELKGLAFDWINNYLYWTDWGSPAKIERATLGGSFRTVIISTGLTSPNGLSIDYEERMLYWVDVSDKIERSTLTGENREVIMQGLSYPFGITVYKQDIFWTDWTERGVFRASKNDGSGFTVLAQNLEYLPKDIHVHAESKQEICSSFCQQFNGGCSHVCVSGPVGPECQCPHEGNWYLANNGKDCIQDTGKRCQADQFTCLNGNCILARWKCDGYNDCHDNSDELERVCAFHTCSATDFTCDNGRCVPLSYTCDYTNDCGDNSDEQGCPFPTCNPATEFTCANGRCISASFVCDGYNDCRDNATSDEINCRDVRLLNILIRLYNLRLAFSHTFINFAF